MKTLLTAVLLVLAAASLLSQTVPGDLLNAGYSLYNAGDYAGAARDFEQVLASDANNLQVHAQLGYTYLHLHEDAKAKAEFEIVAHGDDAALRAAAISQLDDMAGIPSTQPVGPATDGFQLYNDGKYAEAAQVFRATLQTDPTNDAVAAQLGYCDLKLHNIKEAAKEFRVAAYSNDPELRKQSIAELKLLQTPPVYFDVYGDLVYLNRFDDVVGDLQTRLGKSIGGRQSPLSVYWGNSLSRDTNSQNGVSPVIFADNVYMSGVGIIYQPNGRHYSVSGEANLAVNLLKYPINEYTARSDLRVVAGYDNRWQHRLYGPLGALTLFKVRHDRLYTFVDGSAGYYTRYFGDGIAYGQAQEGIRIADVKYLQFLGYARYNLAADTIHEFYNNLGEVGPGFEVRSNKERVSLAVQTEYFYGHYFGIAASRSPNPYSASYNDFRVTMLLGHRF